MAAIRLVHGDLCHEIVGAFYDVFRELGSGFVESVYQRALEIQLDKRGIKSRREIPIAVYFHGVIVGEFRIDLLVADAVIVECKTADRIVPSHRVQLLNYLKATHHSLGIVLNFGPTPTFKRMVNESSRRR